MRIRGIVWGATLEEAKEELTRIKHSYLACHREVTHEVNSRLAGVIEFDNGDLWEAKRVSEDCRGIKCNISYISSKIDKELIDNIILPCTISSPYNGVHYY